MKLNKHNQYGSIRIMILYAIIGTSLILLEHYVICKMNIYSRASAFHNLKEWGFLLLSCGVIFYLTAIELKKKNKLINKLTEEEIKYSQIFEYASDAIFILHNDTIVDSNQKAFDLLKRNKYQVVQKSFIDLSSVKQADNEPTAKKFNEVLQIIGKEDMYSTYWFLSTPEGALIDTLATFSIINISGTPMVQVIAKDITTRVKDQLIIKEREREYKEIVENANSAIIKFNLQGQLDYINEYGERLYGYSLNEIKGRSIFEVFRPHLLPKRKNISAPNEKKIMNRILRNIITQPIAQNWNFTKSGKRIFINWTNKPIYDMEKNLNGVLSIGTDITEQKIMLDRLTESEKKFKLVFNEVTEGITIISLDGEIIDQNKPALEFLGFDRADLQTNHSTINIIKSIIPHFEKLIEKVIQEGEIIFEMELNSPQKGLIVAEFLAKISHYNNKPVILAVSRDITERKNQQMKIFKAAVDAEERERSRVAKELHDSVSPILSTAKLYAQTLQDADNQELIDEIIGKVESSINESIQSIYEISNNLSPHILENFGLIEAIHSFIDKLPSCNISCEVKSNTKERINKEIEITLYRVCTELINNTLKHAKASKIYINFSKNSEIKLEYKDNGIGFNMDDIQNHSKGMGMFNMTNRIKALHGNIDIQSKLNEGIYVKVNVPITS